jgi:hypothetical protein
MTSSPLLPGADKLMMRPRHVCCRPAKWTLSSPIMPALIGAAMLVLRPMPARAQPYLSVNVENGAYWNQVSGGGETINTGGVTSPNPLVETLTNQSSYSASGTTVSATYGLLTATAACYADDGNGSGQGIAQFDTYPTVNSPEELNYWEEFSDSLTITSPSLAQGTAVEVMLTYVDTFQAVESDDDDVSGAPGLGAYFPDGSPYVGNRVFLCPNNASTNVTSVTQYPRATTVGASLTVFDSMELSGNEEGGTTYLPGPTPYSGSCSGSATSRVYVNVLNPQAGYTAASGTVYPKYSPALNIRPALPPSVQMLIYWPGWATNYVLEECPDILLRNWVTNSSPVSLVNGTNEVTLPATNRAKFFRLIGQ